MAKKTIDVVVGGVLGLFSVIHMCILSQVICVDGKILVTGGVSYWTWKKADGMVVFFPFRMNHG